MDIPTRPNSKNSWYGTHISSWTEENEELKENVPPVLQRLIETADHILKGDKVETL